MGLVAPDLRQLPVTAHVVAVTTAISGPDGAFDLRYRVGDSVLLLVKQPGYQSFRNHYERDARVRVRLKPLIANYRPLPNGYLNVGLKTDGSFYGWDFATGKLTSDPAEADLFPEQVDADHRGPIRLRAAGLGGIRFVPRAELGVDDQFLSYGDTAPADAYARQVVLDFTGDGGLYFVRTRDGGHYAKVAFSPWSFFMDAGPDVQRDLSLRYVYNPDGGTDLRFQETGAAAGL